jgi:hypothetical protein
MQVTVNDVRYAVNEALDTAFPAIPISGEEIKQNLKPPYFFVRLLEPAHTQELGRRYRRDLPFLVRYFGVNGNEGMYSMAESLTAVLQRINVHGRPVIGTNMRFQIVDGVLHFLVDYAILVWSSAPVDPVMASLNQEGGLKP